MKRITISLLIPLLTLAATGALGQNCQAYFGYSPVPAEPYTIHFENLSLGNYVYCLWEFGDGMSSSEENPVHTYNAQGVFTVCLTIFDSLGLCNDTYCENVMAGISFPCATSFQASPDTLSAVPNLYHFKNTSSGNLNTWFWEFGDGETSDEFEPSHQYNEKGTYQVCLYAYDSTSPQFCFDDICMTVITLDYRYFGGQLFADGFPINNPSSTGDTGFAYLYKVYGSNIIPFDTNIFYNNIGLYTFNNLLPGRYVIKAGLTPESEHAKDYFPTYFTESVNWLTATVLDLQDTIYDAHIYMKPTATQNFSGPGIISGTVSLLNDYSDEYFELNKPIEVILLSEDFEPLTFAYTDDSGFFYFD